MSKKGRNKKKAAQRRAATSARTSTPTPAVASASPNANANANVAAARSTPSEPPARSEALSDSPMVLRAAGAVAHDTDDARPLDDDEISIPPATQMTPVSHHAGHDTADERDFFERPSQKLLADIAASRDAIVLAEDDELEPPVHAKVRMSSQAIARRAQYRTYVKAAMGICAGVLALGILRTVIHRAGGEERAASADVTATVVHTAPPAAAALPTPASEPAQPAHVDVPPPPTPAETQAAVAQAQPQAQAAPAAAAPAAPEPSTASAPAAIPPTAAAPAVAGGDAVADKKEARKQLERGKAAAAIEAGERSVASDPTDGEAWLILGAAYQQAGKLGEARRCFTSCSKEAKRGPVGECRAMLR